MGAVVKHTFSLSKARSASGVQRNLTLEDVNVWSGAATEL